MEFTRGLLQEVMRKLERNINEILSDDTLTAHLVDELLLFEQELHSVLLSPLSLQVTDGSSLTVLTVLLSSVAFDKWRNLEKARKCIIHVICTPEDFNVK